MTVGTTGITLFIPQYALNIFYAICCAIIAGVGYIAVICHKVNDMHGSFPKIKEALIRVSELLIQKGWTGSPLFTTASPIKLTESGYTVLKESGFYPFFEKHKEEFFKKIKEGNPQTDYDVENISKQIMLNIDEKNEDFNPIKEYAYQHGSALPQFLFVFAIYLRDEYLKGSKPV